MKTVQIQDLPVAEYQVSGKGDSLPVQLYQVGDRPTCVAGGVEHLNGEQELYDLVNDPDELENVAEEPTSSERLARMRLRLLDYRPSWRTRP